MSLHKGKTMLFKRKDMLSEEEKEAIVRSIREAERMTSGEIRVFIEAHCRFVNPLDRAGEVFDKLQMAKTRYRNGVLLYVAIKDKQLAILGDEGIHRLVGQDFWSHQLAGLKSAFAEKDYAGGIARCAREIGASLEKYFPYESGDENELPDDIVFG